MRPISWPSVHHFSLFPQRRSRDKDQYRVTDDLFCLSYGGRQDRYIHIDKEEFEVYQRIVAPLVYCVCSLLLQVLLISSDFSVYF